jgi:hypothetical protein
LPYVGNTPALNYTSFAVQHFTTSATTGYTLDHAVNNENDIRLVINNVIQQPGSGKAYTASGTTLTLSAATAGTDTMYCVFLGKAVQTVNPSQDSVGLNQLNATGTPSSSNFLRGDNSWAAPGGVSLTGSTNNTVATVTGADALAGEAKLTFDGTTLTTNNTTGTSATVENLVITTDTDANPAYANIKFTSGTGGNVAGCWIKGVQASGGNDGRLEFHTNNAGTVGEAMRINYQGIVSIGTTESAYGNLLPAGSNGIVLTDTSGSIIATDNGNLTLARTNADNNNRDILNFNRNGSTCGQITGTNSTTTYATSSDYRLKENVNYDFDATTRLKQLKPARFNFIIDETNTLVDGFLAHEVSGIVPEAIIGEKDGIEKNEDGTNKLDNDGNTIPKYQGIDQAKLVPLLVKTIQELEARIKTLESA